MKRRDFVVGGGVIVVATAGGGVWYARDRGVWSVADGPAYEPWTTWRTETGGSLGLVAAGILAANPHNTQPWLFRVAESQIDLLADTARHLGSFDPYRREMYLGLGCAIENMVHAGRAQGGEPVVSLADGQLDPPPPDDAAVPVARITLESTGDRRPSDLYDAIGGRHTNRGPYDLASPPTPEQVAALEAAAEGDDVRIVFIADPAERTRLGQLIVAATEAIIADEVMVHDSERWYRHSRAEVDRHRDGPTLDAAGLPPFQAALAKLLPRPSAEENHAYWLANTKDIQVATAPALGLILVRDLYDIPTTLRAGRAWQRAHLRATTLGLAMQPLNQPVELVDRERSVGLAARTAAALQEFIADGRWSPTFVFRAGHATRSAPPSPRRPVHEAVV